MGSRHLVGQVVTRIAFGLFGCRRDMGCRGCDQTTRSPRGDPAVLCGLVLRHSYWPAIARRQAGYRAGTRREPCGWRCPGRELGGPILPAWGRSDQKLVRRLIDHLRAEDADRAEGAL
jgi:hypothetical protein